jgi:6-pyruvoyltetrahydropterin/6-carboxytetrahydropterin synthase
MNYTVAQRFTFSASHQLHGLPESHQCARIHGHNYTVTLMLRGADLNAAGMLLDVGGLKPFQAHLDTELDHRHLNDVLPGNPTAEAVARHLYEIAEKLWPGTVSAIRVHETDTSWALAQR